MPNKLSANCHSKMLFTLLALSLPALLLYSAFLNNPLIFDDLNFFGYIGTQSYLDKIFSFNLRSLSYASIAWSEVLLGDNIIWLRLGNLIVHLATTVTLFFFLRRLFDLMLPELINNKVKLSNYWLAFFAALLFSLHPASVYAVGYLIERSILMATLFALLTWLLFLQGLVKNNKVLLIGSCVTYLLAVLSKEHAIMVPAVAAMLVLLVKGSPKLYWFGFGRLSEKNQFNTAWLKPIWLTFTLYALVGLFVVYQVKLGGVLGQAYEPNANEMIARLGPNFNISLIHPLSALNQSTLFFRYIALWLAPNPAAMSIDMYSPFPLSFSSWSHLLGLVMFIIYPIIALRLILKKGAVGLLGFALISPWLLFATEFSSIRIQEAFVIYRSYLWMPCLFVALPFLFQKLSKNMSCSILLLLAIFMFPLSWVKLGTFSNQTLVWGDAIRLAERNGVEYIGMERMYYNRGYAFNLLNADDKAVADYTKAIKIGGDLANQTTQAYNNRAYTYLRNHQYALALSDFKKALALQPNHEQAAIGLQKTLAAIDKQN